MEGQLAGKCQSFPFSCFPISFFMRIGHYYYINKLRVLKDTTGEKQNLAFFPFENFSYSSHKSVTLETAAFCRK